MPKAQRVSAMQPKITMDNRGRNGAFGLKLGDGSEPVFVLSREALRGLIGGLQELMLRMREKALAAGGAPNPPHPDALDPVTGMNFINSDDGSHIVLRARRKSGRSAHVHIPAQGIPGMINALQQSQKLLQENSKKGRKR